MGNGTVLSVAFTAPSPYASRLSALLSGKGFDPLWIPTISTTPTPQTLLSLSAALSPSSAATLSAIAFPSRTAISAAASVLALSPPPLPPSGPIFTLSAIGRDAELLGPDFIASLCPNSSRVQVVVPAEATPTGMVRSLGEGRGRRALCPVPRVVDLEEPPVVGDMLKKLRLAGWRAVEVEAYETKWLGEECLVALRERERVDGLVFSSIAEVEGFLKGLEGLGWGWGMLRGRWPDLVVAAHGPVTAEGAEDLGVAVDVVGANYESFQGVVDALASRLFTYSIPSKIMSND